MHSHVTYSLTPYRTEVDYNLENLEHELILLPAGKRLERIYQKFGSEAVASSSFQTDSLVLLHLIS